MWRSVAIMTQCHRRQARERLRVRDLSGNSPQPAPLDCIRILDVQDRRGPNYAGDCGGRTPSCRSGELDEAEQSIPARIVFACSVACAPVREPLPITPPGDSKGAAVVRRPLPEPSVPGPGITPGVAPTPLAPAAPGVVVPAGSLYVCVFRKWRRAPGDGDPICAEGRQVMREAPGNGAVPVRA